jgi:hypothetical protein
MTSVSELSLALAQKQLQSNSYLLQIVKQNSDGSKDMRTKMKNRGASQDLLGVAYHFEHIDRG